MMLVVLTEAVFVLDTIDPQGYLDGLLLLLLLPLPFCSNSTVTHRAGAIDRY